MQIIDPEHQPLHAGILVCEVTWFQQIAQRQLDGRGLVLYRRRRRTHEDAALEMISAGLASWLRAPVEFMF
ncbi:hypothetical protein [Nocardia sp. NPDC004711]